MSRSSQKHANPTRDLWKPGACSGAPHTPDNKRLARRINRRRRNNAVAREPLDE